MGVRGNGRGFPAARADSPAGSRAADAALAPGRRLAGSTSPTSSRGMGVNFGDLFGGQGQQQQSRRRRRGARHRRDACDCRFEDALEGVEVKVPVERDGRLRDLPRLGREARAPGASSARPATGAAW